MTHRYAVVLGLAAVVVALDQWSKGYIRGTVALYESIVIVPSFFQITHTRNSGGAFSIFAGADDAVRVPFFLGVSLVAIVALLYFVRSVEARRWSMLAALGGILGGAIGNLIDRMLYGQVTDFLDVHWHDYHWPVFNVADSCITVGVLVLLAHSFFARNAADENT